MTHQDLDASNIPILKLKTRKTPDIADKAKQQFKPTATNNKDEQSLEQDSGQDADTGQLHEIYNRQITLS